jgi:hypothetical protein
MSSPRRILSLTGVYVVLSDEMLNIAIMVLNAQCVLSDPSAISGSP